MSANIVITTRVPSSVRAALEQCARVKDVTLSAYCASVLEAHAKDKGFDVSASERPTHSVVPDAVLVHEQVVEDLRSSYQRYLDRGMHADRARVFIELEISEYNRKDLPVAWADLSIE
jgi:hypothetical protein